MRRWLRGVLARQTWAWPAELAGVLAIAAAAAMLTPSLGVLVLGVYAILWANSGPDEGPPRGGD